MYFVTFLMYATLYMHHHCYLADTGNQGRVVTIGIRLRAGRSCSRGSISIAEVVLPVLQSIQTSSGAHTVSSKLVRTFSVDRALESSN